MPETRDQEVTGESGNRNDSLRMAWKSAMPGCAVAAEATEETPTIGDVAGDLGAQLFRARKFLFFAEALPEAYLHALCSDFPGKIEQIRFDAQRSAVEGGPHADIGDRGTALGFTFVQRCCRVRDSARQKLLLRFQVQRRESKAPASAGASDNFAREGAWTAEGTRGVRDVTS